MILFPNVYYVFITTMFYKRRLRSMNTTYSRLYFYNRLNNNTDSSNLNMKRCLKLTVLNIL